MATATENAIQQIYIGLLGRSADPEGLAYWAAEIDANTLTLEQLRANIVNEQPEYATGLGLLTRTQTVEALYQNMFERAADAEGLEYWVNGEGASVNTDQLVLALVNGAAAADTLVLDNKTDAAIYYTENTVQADFNTDAATSAVDPVDSTSASVDASKAATDAGSQTSGTTFTLTTGVDSVTGTANNDTINGVSDDALTTDTFNGLDVIDGGDGTDTLNLSNPAGNMELNTSVKVSNVENLVARSAVADVTADVQAWTGLKSVSVEQLDTDSVDIDTKSNATSVTVTGTSTSVAINDNGTAATTADTLAAVSVTGNTGTASIQSDALTSLSLTTGAGGATVTAAAGARALAVAVNGKTGGTVTDATATSLDISSTGAKSTVGIFSAGSATAVTVAADEALIITNLTTNVAKTLTVTGDSLVTITNDTVGALTTVDASGSTGGLSIGDTLANTVQFTGGAGKDSVALGATASAIAMGAGDDTVTMTSAVALGGSVDAGEGSDTLALTAANANTLSASTTFDAGISNFEKVSVAQVAGGAASAINLANLDGIAYVVSSGGAAATGTKEVQTITIGGTVDATGGEITVGGVDITVANSATTTAVATSIAAQSAALIAANANIESVTSAGSVVTVTYLNTAGNVGAITAANNPTAATFGAVTTATGGVNAVKELHTFTVTNAPTASGIFKVTVDGSADIDVSATLGQTTAETAANIKTAIDAASVSTVESVVVVGSDVQITYTIAGGAAVTATAVDTGDVIFGATNAPTVADTTDFAAATAETQTVEVTQGTDGNGGEITVAGARVVLGDNKTIDEVGATIAGAAAAIVAADSNIASVNYDTNTNLITIVYNATAGNVGAILFAENVTGATYGVATPTTGVAGTAGGTFAITNMADSGTLELTGTVGGASSVAMTSSTGSSDTLNIKLNGAANLVNTAATTVAGVETINIEATDSSVDTPTVTNPAAASTILLNATGATTVNVTGNHGVNFNGSTLTALTTLDASGVTGTGATAAAAATAGAVTFASAQTANDVSLTGGNGDDTLSVANLGATKVATLTGNDGADMLTGGAGADVISGGAGADTIDGNAGADLISGGAGNDIFDYNANTDSVLASRDVISDFSANTVGQGTGGAVTTAGATNTAASRTGDIIDLTAIANTTITVSVQTNAADAQTFLQNNGTNTATAGAALDSTTGLLYIDVDSNGTIDSVLELTGVTTIDAAAFLV